jgi:hypothetical protein
MPARGTGTGTCITAKGYVQITRRGPGRNKLEHRLVMAGMCREFCYWVLGADGIPPGMETHHQDFGRAHNCRSNLILLDPVLHFHMDRGPRCRRDHTGSGFGPNPTPPDGAVVQYVIFHCPQCGLDRRVPVSWHMPEDIPDWVLDDQLEHQAGRSELRQAVAALERAEGVVE